MIDLCIDARMAFSSGIGTHLRELIPFFNQPPFRVILLVDKEGRKGFENIEQIRFPSPIYSMGEQASFPLKIPRCDLFWSPHYNVPLLPTRAKKRIATLHDACHLAFKHTLSFAERMYSQFVMGRALHGSSAAVTDSFFSQRELIRFLGNPKNGLEVIPCGVDPSRFQRTTDRGILDQIRKKYRLPDRYILFVGNLKSHKNLAGLTQAFSPLPQLKAELVVVGKGKGLRNGEKARDEKRISYLEDVSNEDLPAIYTLAELFVFPSFYEGFGLPPLEAMSCGCPTVVSKAASLPEVCGDASLYIDPAYPASISEAIEKVVSDGKLRQELIEKGLKRVKSFGWKSAAIRYRQLFERVHHA